MGLVACTPGPDRGKAIALILLGLFLIIACVSTFAIAVSVEKFFNDATQPGYLENRTMRFPIAWWYAFLYVGPGVFALLAGLTNWRSMHIINIVLSSIVIGVAAIYVIFLLLLITVLSFFDCDTIDSEPGRDACSFIIMSFNGISALQILGWVGTLCSLIVSGINHCCCSRRQSAAIV